MNGAIYLNIMVDIHSLWLMKVAGLLNPACQGEKEYPLGSYGGK